MTVPSAAATGLADHRKQDALSRQSNRRRYAGGAVKQIADADGSAVRYGAVFSGYCGVKAG
jgi:hypothetical protein